MDKTGNTNVKASSIQQQSIERVPYGSLDDSVIPTSVHPNDRNRIRNSLSTSTHHRSHKHDDARHVHHVNENGQTNHGNEHQNHDDGVSVSSHCVEYNDGGSSSNNENGDEMECLGCTVRIPSIRQIALTLSLYSNIAITISKLVVYLQTYSLSVLAALLDSVLDVVSQVVLNYTEQHSSMQRSSAFYPAGASRLEPIGVLTCAALMGMASFEVLKESTMTLLDSSLHDLKPRMGSVYSMLAILVVKLALLLLCRRGANKRLVKIESQYSEIDDDPQLVANHESMNEYQQLIQNKSIGKSDQTSDTTTRTSIILQPSKHVVQFADPTLEALGQDHWNDCLSNGVAAVALVLTVREPTLWFLDPVGAILISIYIIYSWYTTGKEQIEHLTGKSAPEEFIQELVDLANEFDDRIVVDTVRAYHFGPKFLVEIEIVMDASTLLFESHDLGMDLQYEIEGREEVERCFVHIDYQARPYDEHVVSKVPELREKYMKQPSVKQMRSTQSI